MMVNEVWVKVILAERDRFHAQLVIAAEALTRIGEATPKNTNSVSAARMGSWTRAVARHAISRMIEAKTGEAAG